MDRKHGQWGRKTWEDWRSLRCGYGERWIESVGRRTNTANGGQKWCLIRIIRRPQRKCWGHIMRGDSLLRTTTKKRKVKRQEEDRECCYWTGWWQGVTARDFMLTQTIQHKREHCSWPPTLTSVLHWISFTSDCWMRQNQVPHFIQ